MISIIIPTYNRSKYLHKAISSLVGQNISKNIFEVLVVDDGSVDSTKNIVEQFKNQINIKYLHQNHKGVSRARNYGIENSSGEIIAFFDDDAIADINWLYNINKIMLTEYIITGRIEPIKNNIWKFFAPHYNQGDKPVESDVLLEGNFAAKKEVFEHIGKFDDNLTYGHEGKEFISRAKRKYKVMYYPEILIFHDYAFGLGNYLVKQFKFGHKMSYLENANIKNIFYLISNYKRLKLGNNKTANRKQQLKFREKIFIVLIAKLGSMAHFLGALWGYFKYKKRLSK